MTEVQHNDLMARLMERDGVTNPLQKVVHLPMPNDQLEEFLNTSGMTANEVAFAKSWAKQENDRRAKQVKEWVRERRAASVEKGKALDEAIFDTNQAINDLHDRARRGDYSTSRDLFRSAKDLRDSLVRQERVIESLEATDKNIAEIESDPDAYWRSFFTRFHTLADRLPSLAEALSEFRQPKT